MNSRSRPLLDRFLTRIRVTNKIEDCWIWMGPRHKTNYGAIGSGGRGGRVLLTHRLMYELVHGPIPPDTYICHKCDVPECVNPLHLFAGTPQDNVDDMHAKGRARKFKPTHCPYGHAYTPENTHYYRWKGRPHLTFRSCRTCRNAKKREKRNQLKQQEIR